MKKTLVNLKSKMSETFQRARHNRKLKEFSRKLKHPKCPADYLAEIAETV